MKKFIDRFMDAWVQCMTRYPKRHHWYGKEVGWPSGSPTIPHC